jgi:HEAT repeat protein
MVLLSHPDPASRRDAAAELGLIGGDPAIAALVLAFHDPAKDVRAAAAAALASIGLAALGPLIGALADGDWVVRYRAAEALGSIRDGRSVTALIQALGDERDHVRYMAAKGLGNLGERRACRPLAAAVSDDNKFVRRAVMEALASLE